jgi:hypothetical protein
MEKSGAHVLDSTLIAVETWQALTGLIAVLASPLFILFATLRKMSGKIATTEAATLWEEGRDYRHQQAERINLLESQLGDLREKYEQCLTEIRAKDKSNYECQEQVRQLLARLEKNA